MEASFSHGDPIEKTLHITRLADPEHYLIVPRTLVIDDSHIGGLLVPVRTDAEDSNMTVDTDASWLTITPAYYEGQILIEAELNPLSTDRSTFVTVQVTYPDGTVLTDDFEVVEKPKPEIAMHSVAFDPEILDVTSKPSMNPTGTAFPVSIITEGTVQSLTLHAPGPDMHGFGATNPWARLDNVDLEAKSFDVVINSNFDGSTRGTYVIAEVTFADGVTVEANLPVIQEENQLFISIHYHKPADGYTMPASESFLYVGYFII